MKIASTRASNGKYCEGKLGASTGNPVACGASGSLVHIAHCPALHQFTFAHMRKHGYDMTRTLDTFLCMTSNYSEEEATLRGVVNFASYRLFNLLRAGGLPDFDISGAFR